MVVGCLVWAVLDEGVGRPHVKTRGDGQRGVAYSVALMGGVQIWHWFGRDVYSRPNCSIAIEE